MDKSNSETIGAFLAEPEADGGYELILEIRHRILPSCVLVSLITQQELMIPNALLLPSEDAAKTLRREHSGCVGKSSRPEIDDRSGRIYLPRDSGFRKGESAWFVGNSDCIELWSASRWDKMFDTTIEELRRSLPKILVK